MQVSEVKEKVNPILREYGVKRAAIFGSIARGDSTNASDVDILIDLGESNMGMIKHMEFIEKMENKLGRKVDLVTENSGAKFLKPHIISDLKIIYEG